MGTAVTCSTIRGLVEELNGLVRIGSLSEYAAAKNLFLEKALPILSASRRTRPAAGIIDTMLKIDRYIPSKGEASPQEIKRIEREALAEVHKRIGVLDGMLRDAMKTDLPLLALSFLFLASGVFCLFFIGRLIGTAAESREWPPAAGHLSKIRLSERRSSSYAGRIGTRNETVTYGLDVEYIYTVNGTPYKGNRFSFEPSTADRAYWEAKALQYRAGSRVSVRYDPRNPGNSVLETGAHEGNYIFIIMGLGFAFVGLYFMARIIRFRFF